MRDEEEDEVRKPPLARWTDIADPAGIGTKTGKQRFVVTIKLPEKTLKTASSLVKEMNDALSTKIGVTPDCELVAKFVLIDSERTRLQRTTASFSTFKDAQTCLRFLKELGLRANDISPELEDFGTKQYDPWYKSISQAWWPWFAEWRNPAPEMPMPKVKSRLSLTEGSKYKQGAKGKLGKSDEEGRDDAEPEEKKEDVDEVKKEDADEVEKEKTVKRRPKKKKARKKEENAEEETPREEE